ncbi:glutathione S-transferase family protein [Bauldia sp.]|uniref:glutathione S-transferase family protein n=1 Tax=Bauldia sp. TaxID=2575872 RepID=UPI003BA9CB30
MTIRVSALDWAPESARGFVKDLRVRWALEEAGLPYEIVPVCGDERASPTYREWQPFGQVPAFSDGDTRLFESGAIVLHIAARSEVLAPLGAEGQAQVATWIIAALNSVEPYVSNVVELDAFYAGEAWVEHRRPSALAALAKRLDALVVWLGDKDFLEDRFTAADIVMATVLRELEERPILTERQPLVAYRERCLARPAFTRALAAQLEELGSA